MRTIQTAALAAALGLIEPFTLSAAHAQDKFPYDYSTPPATSRYTQRHAIPVPDVAGHEIVIYELQRTFGADAPKFLGVKLTENWSYGIADQINGVGATEGYTVWTLEDGSKLFSDFRGSVFGELTDTGFRRGTYHGATRFTGGTGRFAQLRGTLTDDIEYYTDPKVGFNRPVTHGQYWLLK
jgi:hypothetical protein